MTKLIIFNNKFGDIVRIGLYENGKWLKWVKKKDLDSFIDLVDEMENQII